MTQRLKLLFQKNLTTGEIAGATVPPGTGPLLAYTVSDSPGRMAVVSTIVICNRGTADSDYYVGIVAAANIGTWNDNYYIVFGAKVPAKDSEFLTLGLGIGPGDQVRVWSPSANVGFHGFGM